MALTETVPLVLPKVTFMALVPCPLLILAPEGTVQEYAVAPEIVEMEKFPVLPEQAVALPKIAPGIEGAEFKEIDKLELVPVPHEFMGETETLPTEDPKFTEILLVPAPEARVAPLGKVQL